MINLLFLLAAILAGCVSAPIAPNLKLPERSAKACPQKELLPVPQKAFLSINGDTVVSDAGGDMLLRQYVLARELLK